MMNTSRLMKSLSQQGSMGTYVKMSDYWANYITLFFVFAMSLVLWNAGFWEVSGDMERSHQDWQWGGRKRTCLRNNDI